MNFSIYKSFWTTAIMVTAIVLLASRTTAGSPTPEPADQQDLREIVAALQRRVEQLEKEQVWFPFLKILYELLTHPSPIRAVSVGQLIIGASGTKFSESRKYPTVI